jgi:hypothetical protein
VEIWQTTGDLTAATPPMGFFSSINAQVDGSVRQKFSLAAADEVTWAPLRRAAG